MSAEPRVLIGASIPRSGHHFLQNLLTRYFGPELYYCEFYSPKACCRQVPCIRRGDFRVIFQKSHDRDHALPRDVADALYLIQYRHPVPEALSDRELDIAEGFGRVSPLWRRTREYYAQWLALKAIYYRRFHDRWMLARVPNAEYLDYDAFSPAPGDAIERIVRWATGDADRARIDALVEAGRGVRVSARGSTVFKPRVPQDSPHFDADLLGAMEDYILARAPEFGWTRQLTGRFEGHPLSGLILALDESERLPPGAYDRLDAAIALAGEHPELVVRLAARQARAGDHAGAAARLRALLERHPDCTVAYKPLLTTHRQAGLPPPVDLFGGRALFAMLGRPEALAEAGKALLDDGQLTAAVGALAMAATAAPELPRARHLLADALLRAGRPTQALPHAEAAFAADPDNAAAAQLLALVRKRLGG